MRPIDELKEDCGGIIVETILDGMLADGRGIYGSR
jgi:hypothetical protein